MGTHEKVMKMVRRQLERDPPPPTAALYGRAANIDPDIYDLSLRQFHAKYPLRVKRERAREERREETPRADGEPGPAGGAETAPGEGGNGKEEDDEGAGEGDRGPDRPRRASGASGAPAAGGARERVRAVLLRLARDVAVAEGAADLAGVVGRLPERVDEVEAILRGA